MAQVFDTKLGRFISVAEGEEHPDLPDEYNRETARTKHPGKSLYQRIKSFVPTALNVGNALTTAGYITNPYAVGALGLANVVHSATKGRMPKQHKSTKQQLGGKGGRRMPKRGESGTAIVPHRSAINIEEVD
jgi:hypothetical protein